MVRLSAFVITFNAERTISRCLSSLNFCDEVIVVDSGSKDRTVEIAKCYTDKVMFREWLGINKQKQFAMELCKNEWVLNLDADEVISPELKSEIERIFTNATIREDGFLIPRKSFFMGRWITHTSWYPDLKLRLFRKAKARFTGKDPHDRVEVKGRIRRLKGKIEHYSYEDYRAQVEKLQSYAFEWAKTEFERKRKFRLFNLIFHPPYSFFKDYVLKFGFIDGVVGLIISVMNSYYTFMKYARLWELEKDSKSKIREEID